MTIFGSVTVNFGSRRMSRMTVVATQPHLHQTAVQINPDLCGLVARKLDPVSIVRSLLEDTASVRMGGRVVR